MKIFGLLKLFSLLKFAKFAKRDLSVVFDVDGVLSDGKFYYTNSGKVMKVFGSHDSEALKLLSKNKNLNVIFVSADKRGFQITKKRVKDLGFKVVLLNSEERVNYLNKLKSKKLTIFVGDSFTDIKAFKSSDFSIAPKNAHYLAKRKVDLILKSNSAEGAISEVCLLISKFSRGCFE